MMEFQRKINTIGKRKIKGNIGTLAVTIPSDLVKLMGLKGGDIVKVHGTIKQITIERLA